MDAAISGVRVAETPTGLVGVVTLEVDDDPDDNHDPDDGYSGTDEEVGGGGEGENEYEAGGENGFGDEYDPGDGDRGTEVLPIFIGMEEAVSIVRGLEAEDIGRPMTHDLLLDIMEELGGRVDRIVVSDLRDGTYVADLHIEGPRDSLVVDARPSDSLALAARTNVPIEVDEEVFEAGREPADKFADLEDIGEAMEP